MRSTTRILSGVLLLSLLAATGCTSRVIKEGFGAVRGAKGVHVALQPLPGSLAEYGSFELGEFRDDFGGKMPPQLLAMLPVKFNEQLQKADLPLRAGGPTAIVRGTILHYEAAGLVGNVFGPLEEVVARVELVDAASGRVLGTANAIGRSTESINLGVDAKATGLAKAIVEWIAENYPKAP